MSIDSLADAFGESFIARAMDAHEWIYPGVESLHMIFVVLLVGTAALVDFRLLGWRLNRMPVAELASEIFPWTRLGLIGVLITGPLLLSTDPDRYLANFAFRFKMTCVFLALLFDFFIARRLRSKHSQATTVQQRLVGAISLLLWTGVVAGGRSIGVFKMQLLELCQWLQESPLRRMVREGYWGYGVPQIIHLAGMALFGGTVVMTDLRLLGRIQNPALRELNRQLWPLKWAGLLLTSGSGLLLFMSDATRFYKNPAFLIKIILLLLIALNGWLLHSAVYKRRGELDRAYEMRFGVKLAAASSLILWIAVILASRIIGFTLPDV